jgi:SPP1 family predicted phage head-tail adaptor
MNIGKLKHKVTIQEFRALDNDGGGNVISDWVDVATVWANVKPITGQESTIAERKAQQLTHTVSMRYRAISKDKNRLLFNGRVLTIEYILNVDELNRELRLNCLEV